MTSRPSHDSHASPIPEVTLSLDPAEQNGQPAHSADRQSQSNLPPSQQSHPRPGPLRLSDRLFDTDDLAPPLPSPPYKRVPSASNLKPDAQPTPPYRSSSSIDLMEKPVLDDKGRFSEQHDASNEQQNAKPTVHYHQDTNSPAPEYAGGPSRTNSFPLQHSRQPSYATSDDGEDDDEDYDWSAEEDLVDEEAKFESQMGIKQKRKGWGPKRIFTLLFGSLIGSMFVAGLLVAGPILVHFFWYKPNPTAHRRYVLDNIEAWLFWAAANVLISWWLAMIIDVVPAIFRGIVALSWGHVSEKIKTRIEMYNSVRGSVKPLFYAASGWVSWIILFEHIYKLYDGDDPSQSQASYTERLFDVIEFIFFLALVWCAQKMLSHMIAFAFHQTAFKDRIDYLREALVVIERLRDYRPKHKHRSGGRTPNFFGFATPAFERDHINWGMRSRTDTPEPLRHTQGQTDEEDHLDADDEDAGGKGKTRKGKAKDKKNRMSTVSTRTVTPDPEAMANSRGTMDSPSSPHRYPPVSPDGVQRRTSDGSGDEMVVMQAAKALKNAVLHDARNIQGKEGETGGLVWDVTSAHEAKRLARLIYNTFKDRKRRFLLPSDFEPAYGTPEAAQKAFRVFDTDNNGDISRAEIKTTLLKIYKERRFLSRSMRDVGNALHTLDSILLFFAAIILFFISLSVFGVNFTESLTSVYTIGIAASFIFSASASNAFDSVMFLFVTHPFDTGDRVFIDDENLVVKKMGLFATIFARADGTETYYFNSILFNKFITNARRSDKTFENLTMQLSWRTPIEKLDQLEKCINEWLQKDENRWFQPSTSIMLQNITFQRHLEITMGIGHNGTWQDWGLRLARKTAFHAAVQYYCRELGIVAYEAPIPIVYADPDTGTYTPTSPNMGFEDFDVIPPSPSVRSGNFESSQVNLAVPEATAAAPGQDRERERDNGGWVPENERPIPIGGSAAPAPADAEVAGVNGAGAGAGASASGVKRTWLGFTPLEDGRGSEVRARRAISKKAVMRGMGADG